MSTDVAASLDASATVAASTSSFPPTAERNSADVVQSSAPLEVARGSVDKDNTNLVEEVTHHSPERESHNDLEAYRNSRRLSRPSSRLEHSASTSRSVGHASPGKQSQEQEKSRHEGAPTCLVSLTERIENCTQSMQAWSDRQEEKVRLKKERKADAGVVIKEDGTVVEPDSEPWLERKGIIILVTIILSWVYLVFTWRICAAGIRRESRALISREQAIGLLVGFNIIWLTTIWTYIRVILTPPGFVRDHVSISEAPVPPKEEYNPPHTLYPSTDINSGVDTSQVPDATAGSVENAQKETKSEEPVDPTLPAIIGPLGAGQVAKADEEKAVTSEELQQTNQAQYTPCPPQQTLPAQGNHTDNNNTNNNTTLTWIAEPSRVPPQSSPLHPDNLYCYRCKRVKPPRAHHCRKCATCVLKMDHHCPWVGGCVGARNHKFFYHFLQWVTTLEVYTLIVNSIVFSRGIHRRSAGGQGWSIDGYMISLFPICVIFILFTSALLITHSYLFMLNLTTIEHLAYDRMKTREEILLSRYLDARRDEQGNKLTFPAKHKEKRRLKAKWAQQWGNLKSEANLWWIDDEANVKESKKQRSWYHSIGPNWKQAMGNHWYQWILPFGRAKSDGLHYDRNWRFSEGGFWRERRDWT